MGDDLKDFARFARDPLTPTLSPRGERGPPPSGRLWPHNPFIFNALCNFRDVSLGVARQMTTQYRHVLIDASKPPPTEAALAALAAAAGSALPSDFVEFLKSANGARHDFSVTVEHTDGSLEEVLFGHHFSTGLLLRCYLTNSVTFGSARYKGPIGALWQAPRVRPLSLRRADSPAGQDG